MLNNNSLKVLIRKLFDDFQLSFFRFAATKAFAARNGLASDYK